MDGLDYIDPRSVSDERRPSGRQIYKVEQVALAALGRPWPQTGRDATELINELQVEPLVRALSEQFDALAQALEPRRLTFARARWRRWTRRG